MVFCITTYVQAQHTLILKSGEKMTGTVQQIKDGTISFLFKGNAMTFPVSETAAIYFSEGANEIKSGKEMSDSGMRGVKYEMPGRTLTKPPKIENLTMEKGIVVVEITIDKYGHVTKASPGAEGTTTTSNYLLTKAKQAAESVLFDNCAKCPLETKGTITLTF
jgi:hypothetical protein